MQVNLNEVPIGAWSLMGMLLASPVITSITMFFLNKKKTQAEVDNIIGKSYYDLLQAYKEERELMAGEMETFRKQQTTYMENANELIKSNRMLREDIGKLKTEHKLCNETNKTLTEQIKLITDKLVKNGIQ